MGLRRLRFVPGVAAGVPGNGLGPAGHHQRVEFHPHHGPCGNFFKAEAMRKIGDYLLGQPASQYGLSETNIILVFFVYFYVHLQHSQLRDRFHRLARSIRR